MRLVVWEMTAGCNLECRHCRRLEVSREMMRDDLSTAEGRRLIDRIAEVGRPSLVLSGGEPLVRRDIFDLAGHAVARGLTVWLATNGTLVDWPTAQAIRAAGICRVRVGLDGARAETHDGFRRQLGSFHKALEGIAWLRRAGLEVEAHTTIGAHNAAEVREIYDLTCGVGAVALHAFLLVPVGRGRVAVEDQTLEPARYSAVLGGLACLAAEGRIECKVTCAPQYYRIGRRRDEAEGRRLAPRRHGMAAMTDGCQAGSAACFVSHKGEVFSRGSLPISAGNVWPVPSQLIWRHSLLFGKQRDADHLEGKCGGAEYSVVCGGCRARAFAEIGNFGRETPYCSLVLSTRAAASHQRLPIPSG